MNTLFRDYSKSIRVYLATETIQDPYERNVDFTQLNPIPIKAIVTDLIDSKIRWTMPGIITEKAKALIINKRHRSLIEKSYRIEIDGEYYEGYKINGRLQLRDDGEYTRLYVYIKQV